ncbi:hypothetical protein CDAR_497121 [Caerostris darwini]|uniref:Uncharacterized protein n=1 Tax=Caerostris darwini TaxID=1538125 RepID=A0AAV4S3A9_9ARAC|nr:hypothetical protein CDAR_497121 [Caerostris darwini]
MVCLRKPVNHSLRPKPKERPMTKFEVKRSGHLIGCCVSLGGVNGILISCSARKLAARELHYGKRTSPRKVPSRRRKLNELNFHLIELL